MKDYLPRIADKILEDLLSATGAVLIQGPKWCGKTTTGRMIAKSVIEMDNPEFAEQYLQLASINPSQLLKGDVPLLIDEWQYAPSLWNAVRYEVDKRDEFGQFILTGSSVPPVLDKTTHTGTGRIARMTMRPMSLFESQDSNGNVSLKSLFNQEYIEGTDNHQLLDIAYLICRGGWPKSVGVSTKTALIQGRNYYDAIVYDDIDRADGVEKNREKTKKLLKSYARNIAQQVSLEQIRKDIIEIETESFSQNTLYSYLEALKKIFVIEDAPAWNPNLRSKTAIRTTETRYFVDPSIATSALGLGPEDLINDLNTMGLIFENLCVRDLRVYAQSIDGDLYHYRDKEGLECDAVIHLRNGSYGLIEIKLGGDKLIEEGAESLNKLASKIDTTKMKKPAFKMVLCGVAPFAYKRNDDVYVVPICALKD